MVKEAIYESGLALKQGLVRSGCKVKWVNSHAQVSDGLTKSPSNAVLLLRNFLESARWRVIFDERHLSAKKRMAAGIGIFDDVMDGDREKANENLERRKRDFQERQKLKTSSHDGSHAKT